MCVCVILTRVKDPSAWACKVVGLLVVANAFNVVEGQVEDQDLDDARVGRCDDLGHEHGPGGYFHVVAEFEIRYEIECLGPSKICHQELL